MFSKPLSTTNAKEKRSVFETDEDEVYHSFRVNFKFLERINKPLSLASRRNTEKIMAEAEKSQENADEVAVSVVTYTEEELTAVKENMASENTKKSTGTSVYRLQSWYMGKYKSELSWNSISEKQAPQLLKHFFIEIQQTTNENKGK